MYILICSGILFECVHVPRFGIAYSFGGSFKIVVWMMIRSFHAVGMNETGHKTRAV